MRVHVYKKLEGEARYMVEPSPASGLIPVVLKGKDLGAVRQALRETIETVAAHPAEAHINRSG